MVTPEQEVTQLVLTQLSKYPGVVTYRARPSSRVVHVSVRWQLVSLCGLAVQQDTWRPADDSYLCKRCLRSVRAMGLGRS